MIKSTKRILLSADAAAVFLRLARNSSFRSAVIRVSSTIGFIISEGVAPCLSSMSAGFSKCDKADKRGSTILAFSFKVAFATFLRTGDMSAANFPVSNKTSGSNNFADCFKSRIWSLGNLCIHVLNPLLSLLLTNPSSCFKKSS